MIDLLTLLKPENCAPEDCTPKDRVEERPVNLPPHLPQSESSSDIFDLDMLNLDMLNLLVPWDIPLECQLSDPIKQQISTSLRSLHQALNHPDEAQALTQISQIISTLPSPNTQPAQIDSTKTALSPAAVTDYDTYFKINHIQTTTAEDTALSLTHSFLTNAHKFITLCATTPLDPLHIAQQKQGFITYINLLTRVFNISNLLE
ncbi:MAG: hypothetical protein AAFQ63_06090 [Cyanobacteria bacterium J06621_11]